MRCRKALPLQNLLWVVARMNKGLDLVVVRNEFYRDGYYRVLFCVLVLLAMNILLVGMVYHRWTNPPAPQYFAATADGRVIKVQALSDPSLTDDFVLQWTANAVHKAFTMDFIHWREQLQDASNNFTPDGWTYFSDTLKKSDNLKTLAELKMVSNAVITGAPQVIQKAVVDGHYAWSIKLPMLITYSSSAKTISQPVKVTVIVLREPVQYYPQKIAINNIFVDAVDPAALNNGPMPSAG